MKVEKEKEKGSRENAEASPQTIQTDQSLICYREMSTNQVKADYPHKFKPA